jgi:nucleotide-binding universal stress UspA family protein
VANFEAETPKVIVWFEDDAAGRAALRRAYEIADTQHARLTVLTVATRERVIGCGRCLQGTVLWNIEMKKIACEDLRAACLLLENAPNVEYEWVVGAPVDSITEIARSKQADTIVLPRQRTSLLTPPQRRHVSDRVGINGPWQVIVGPEPGRLEQASSGLGHR